MRPVTKFAADLLVDISRLLNPVDGNISISKHKRLEVPAIVNDMIVYKNLDTLPEHRAVFGRFFANLLDIIFIPITLLFIVAAITGFNINTAAFVTALLGNPLDLRLESFLLGLALSLLPLPLVLLAFLLCLTLRLLAFLLCLALSLIAFLLSLTHCLLLFPLAIPLRLFPLVLTLFPLPLLLRTVALLLRLLPRPLPLLLRPLLIPLPLLRSPIYLLLAPLPLPLLPIPNRLLPIPNRLLTIPLSLTTIAFHLPHLPLLILIPNRRLDPLHDIRIFRQLVLRNKLIIDVKRRRLIIHINYLVAMPPDTGREDILPHRREEDMVTVPDRIGSILPVGKAGRSGKEEGQCNFQAHGFLFFSMISRGIIQINIPETPPYRILPELPKVTGQGNFILARTPKRGQSFALPKRPKRAIL